MQKIFSIEQDSKHIIYRFLFFKFSRLIPRLYKLNKEIYSDFMNHDVKPNTILIAELNDCHFETIAGYCKFLLDLGYNVEIITRCLAEGAFDNSFFSNIPIYECGYATFNKICNDFDFSKYERILYNSKRIYGLKNRTELDGVDINDCSNFLQKGQKSNIYVQHHIDKINDTPDDTQIILANPCKKPELEKLVVNPHYFGEFNSKNYKNDIVKFITIGELSKQRRNTNLLIEAVKALHEQGEQNFSITIIGKGQLEDIPTDIRQYFQILGRVDYQTMYKELVNADYILPLLDPEIDAHKRYMDSGTTGTFQLVYGFNKPCIIHKTFADIYGFDTQNSLIYENNSQLAKSMKDAIDVTNTNYCIMQNELSIKANKIYQEAKINLNNILKKSRQSNFN